MYENIIIKKCCIRYIYIYNRRDSLHISDVIVLVRIFKIMSGMRQSGEICA